MFDGNTYLSIEIRHWAFRKSCEQATWQNALKQQHTEDSEHRLDKLAQTHLLANLSNALHFGLNLWMRTHQQAPAMMNNLPSRH